MLQHYGTLYGSATLATRKEGTKDKDLTIYKYVQVCLNINVLKLTLKEKWEKEFKKGTSKNI